MEVIKNRLRWAAWFYHLLINSITLHVWFKSWDLSSLFNGQMVTLFQIVNYDKLWWQHREFLTWWMRKSEGGELWGGVEVGDRTGFKEEQGVPQRGVGSCSWILSAVAHSSPTCWDSFLSCTLRARKSCGSLAVHQGSSVAFFCFSFLKLCFSVKQSLDCIKMLQMETLTVVVPGSEAMMLLGFFLLWVVLENVPSSILQIINPQNSKEFCLISYAWC